MNVWCKGCQASLPRAAFGSDRDRPDGIARPCLACRRARHHRQNADDMRAAARPDEAKCEGIFGCTRAGTFVLADGSRCCARCLKAIVSDRRSA